MTPEEYDAHRERVLQTIEYPLGGCITSTEVTS